MTDDEPLYLDCGPHGRRVAAVVCGHMIGSLESVGFVENSSDPNNLQAWCEKCEEVFSAEGDKTESFEAFNDRAIVCCVCYSEFKARHSIHLHAKTIRYGSHTVPLLTRDLVTAARKPYKKTYRLNPGQHWRDAEETASQWEAYVLVNAGEYEPIGASVARELIEAGAYLAGFIEMWAGRIVFVDENLVCQQIDGRLAEIINTVRKANDGKLGGFPDVIGLFPDGRIAFREVKNIDSKDRLGSKQHKLADLLRELFGDQLDLQVVEWGGEIRNEGPRTSRGRHPSRPPLSP